jgi:hypothetical protein
MRQLLLLAWVDLDQNLFDRELSRLIGRPTTSLADSVGAALTRPETDNDRSV